MSAEEKIKMLKIYKSAVRFMCNSEEKRQKILFSYMDNR